MDMEVRDQISRLIGELHSLYRLDDSALFDQKVEEVRQSVMHLGAMRPQENSRTPRRASMPPGVVSTTDVPSLYQRLSQHIEESTIVRIASAFLSASETNPLIRPLERLCAAGGTVRVLTSLMGFFNRPDTLLAFLHWGDNLSLRLYVDDPLDVSEVFAAGFPAFHAKTLLFEKRRLPNVVAVGSANVTGAGMRTNIEWNYISDFEVNSALTEGTTPYHDAVTLFDTAWDCNGYQPDAAFIERYREFYERAARLTRDIRGHAIARDDADQISGQSQDSRLSIAPRPAQQDALKRLEQLRGEGVRRFAIIAATGLGKTLLSAFEVRNAGVQRALFLAHREIILSHAMENYHKVFPGVRQELIQGGESVRRIEGDNLHVFAMVQTLSRKENLRSVDPNFFDYIIVDEFHHASAESYRTVIDYFRPSFLLGMTATPERTDGQEVLELCDRTVAYEARLMDAIERKWLTPFHYFALYDPTDFQKVRWTGTGYDEVELEKALSQDTRAALISTALNRYQPSLGKHKCLAFCSNTGHARWMAQAFSKSGFKADVVLAETDNAARKRFMDRLQDEADELRILCTVDVLSEGIDIPLVTHILLLRPTLSFTVFLQQIGRGLRLHPDKPFVTVLDFVGNFRKSYVAPLALQGLYSVPATKPHSLAVDAFRAPAGCFVDADSEVRDVWDEAVRAIAPRESKLVRLRAVLEELASEKSIGEVRLPELFNLDDALEYAAIVRDHGGWLAVRSELGLLFDREKTLLGTTGEKFLKHIEQDLSPNRSYKMAVLHGLLDEADRRTRDEQIPVAWSVSDIAEAFLAYYCSNKRRMADWRELARSPDPYRFPISRAASHVKKMPLYHLSSTASGPEEKYFDLVDDRFSLKMPVHDYWRDPYFRSLVRERVEFAEARYWYRQMQTESADA